MKTDIIIKNAHFVEITECKPASFEDAIKATGIGTFNLLLISILIPCSFAQLAEQVGMAYVVPIAQCDLDLTLEDKGYLNSMGYAGMITSGFLWGYICDIYGRRKIVIYGFLLNSLCFVLAAFSQNFSMLLAAKFFSGLMFTGPFSAVTTYLSEFHSASNRSKIQIVRGMTAAIATICFPLIGWEVLPSSTRFFITDNIRLQSWNIFLIICALPAFISAIIFISMPESPKFLMTHGRNEEALKVLQWVYRLNSGKKDCFPVQCLVEEKQKNDEIEKEQKSVCNKILSGFHSVKPLFCRPHLLRLIHTCLTAMTLISGVYGLKLWYPQILQGVSDYEKKYGSENITICSVIDILTQTRDSTTGECTVNLDNSTVYINAAILGAVHLTIYILAGFAVNLGKKTLLASFATIAAVSPMIIYFFSNAITIRILFPIILALGELCATLLTTVTLELFPTSYRITALTIMLTTVRMGTAVGNVIFPYLLRSGCLPLLLFVTLCITIAVILTSAMPSTENQPLK